MTAEILTKLRERIQESRRAAVAQFRDHERPDILLTELRRIVDAALRDLVKPIGIAEWQTRLVQSLPEHLQGSLPTIAELEAELEKAEEENR